MKRLGVADYRKMPWANGRGVTTELIRVDKPGGGLLWRLSMAAVVENGPFSLFPGIERNLTVIAGPGFELRGSGIDLRARPFEPVAFPGDVEIAAHGVSAPSQDFNVMTDRAMPRPEVTMLLAGEGLTATATTCLFAAEKGALNLDGCETPLALHDLLILDKGTVVHNTGKGRVIAVRLAP